MDTVQELQTLLATNYVLYTKTQHFHWNVTSKHFYMLHTFFEEQYEELAKANDVLAERIRMLGEYAFGTHAEFNEHSLISEQPKVPNAEDMLRELEHDHQIVIDKLLKVIPEIDADGDLGTADLLTTKLRWHEKTLWMIKSHLL